MGKLTQDAVFQGKSGNNYIFEVYTVDTPFSDVGAVYVFSTRTIDPDGRGKHDFLYIGETSQLGTRIDNHEKWPCVNQ